MHSNVMLLMSGADNKGDMSRPFINENHHRQVTVVLGVRRHSPRSKIVMLTYVFLRIRSAQFKINQRDTTPGKTRKTASHLKSTMFYATDGEAFEFWTGACSGALSFLATTLPRQQVCNPTAHIKIMVPDNTSRI